jgi:hypothetical protein
MTMRSIRRAWRRRGSLRRAAAWVVVASVAATLLTIYLTNLET